MPLARGQILQNRYRIAKLIGQGGFGAVYRAWDLSLNKFCAVKENHDTSQNAQRQFHQEAILMANLNHSNLPHVFDHFDIPGQGQYLVMDFVEGESLEQLLHKRGRPFTEAEVLPWVEQVCSALQYLHTRTPPVIHRDIKPQNIIITPTGQAMLVDFGISKAYHPSQNTTVGAKAYTAGYSPPEQYGFGKTDARSDIYAFGATLYTLLTGSPPPESVHMLGGRTTLPAPRKMNPGISAQMEKVLLHSMALDANGRFQSAQQMWAEMSQADTKRTWLLVGSLALVAAVTFIFIWSGYWLSDQGILGGGGALPTRMPTAVPEADALATLTPDSSPITPAPSLDEATITSTAPPLDRDGDSFPDDQDLCPDEPGPLSGCSPSLTPTVTVTPFPTAKPTPELVGPLTVQTGPYGRIAFVSDRDGLDSIYVMDVQSPQSVQRITQAVGYDWWPTWCGSNQIAFERADRSSDDEIGASWMEIALVSATGGPVSLLTSANMPLGSNMNGSPGCSRNGRYLAFSSRTAPSGNQFKIGWLDMSDPTPQFNMIGDGYALGGNVSWSLDHQSVVFMHYRDADFHIYRVNMDRTTEYLELSGSGNDKYPDLSPRGDLVAYACTDSRGENRAWSLCMTPADRSQVDVMLFDLHSGLENPSDGSRTRHAITPSWSPDGQWIAFSSSQNDNWDIYIYNIITGELLNLTNTGDSDEFHPAWRYED